LAFTLRSLSPIFANNQRNKSLFKTKRRLQTGLTGFTGLYLASGLEDFQNQSRPIQKLPAEPASTILSILLILSKKITPPSPQPLKPAGPPASEDDKHLSQYSAWLSPNFTSSSKCPCSSTHRIPQEMHRVRKHSSHAYFTSAPAILYARTCGPSQNAQRKPFVGSSVVMTVQQSARASGENSTGPIHGPGSKGNSSGA